MHTAPSAFAALLAISSFAPAVAHPGHGTPAPAALVTPGPLPAALAAELGDDCRADTHARVLTPALTAPLEARAAWVGATDIVWPGVPGAGRFALVHAAGATLDVRVGAPVRGADGRLPLTVAAARAEPPKAQSHVGPGTLLRLAGADRAAQAGALRGQVVLVLEDADGLVREATTVQHAAVLDALYADAADGRPYGARVEKAGGPARTTFQVWAPTARQVRLCLGDGPAKQAAPALPMLRDEASGAWVLERAGDLSGRRYRYLVDVVVPGVGLVRNRVTDPYALALTADSTHTVVADLSSPALAPAGWANVTRPQRVQAPTDLTIYELHVRDFSISDRTVPKALRRTYDAFSGPRSDGMRHLKRLADAGMTDVHLLPVFDLATVPERGCVTPDLGAAPGGAPDGEAQQAAVEAVKARDCFNWGYDPLHYTAPEGSFAPEPADALGRIKAFRRMVMALHRLGLRVGMDVVYNHTSASGQHPQSVLDRIVPGYYHRLDATGKVERSTCCDNTATEHRMMARLMIDSVVTWARDHRIDSFRFDLMGHQPRDAMERLQREVNAAAGRHIHLIGEGWNFGEVADGARFVQASQLSLNGSGIGTFSDRGRDAARGGSAGDGGVDQLARQGFVNGLFLAPNPHAEGRATREDLLRTADMVRVGLAGTLRGYRMTTADGSERALQDIVYAGSQPAGYASAPHETVNYVENHDNQTLFDANVFKLPPGTPPAERARVQHLGSALVALSQGIAYFHAGQEILRSKSMDRNSYDSGDWFNALDWTLTDNGFGRGLPPAQDNRASWPWMRPLLADASIKPEPAHIRWSRDAFLDLLRIRASSTLLRLRSADDVAQRLRFHNTGPGQVPGVIVGEIDGRGYPGANFGALLYGLNVDTRPQTVPLPALRGQGDWVLHPVHRAPQAADTRALQARLDGAEGRLEVPARTVVVWVRLQK